MLKADAVCTVWTKAEQNRVAVWEKVVIPCSWQPVFIENRTESGQMEQDGVSIFDWTDTLSLGDYIENGASTASAPTDPLRITECRRYTFNGEYHHTEAVAR